MRVCVHSATQNDKFYFKYFVSFANPITQHRKDAHCVFSPNVIMSRGYEYCTPITSNTAEIVRLHTPEDDGFKRVPYNPS